MGNITNTRTLYFRNKGNKRPSETHSISLSSSSTSSTTPLPLAAKARNRQPAFIPSGSKADHQHAIPRPKSPYFNRQSNLSAGAQNSAPQYPSPPILRTPAAPIQPHSFLPHRPSPQHNRSSVLSPSFEFQPIMTRPTDSNRHKTDNAGNASTSSSSSDLIMYDKRYSSHRATSSRDSVWCFGPTVFHRRVKCCYRSRPNCSSV